ncbi:MAG: hypothetical protein JO189_30595 [Deltaproteobacteria bacterium]|nr:hypothetical protein [Deltaproteobacteria bacterium]
MESKIHPEFIQRVEQNEEARPWYILGHATFKQIVRITRTIQEGGWKRLKAESPAGPLLRV